MEAAGSGRGAVPENKPPARQTETAKAMSCRHHKTLCPAAAGFKRLLGFGAALALAAASWAAGAASPLVLQYEASHVRNKDQISLIFRKTTAELAVNTSSWQTGPKPRLGRFGSDLTPGLKSIKQQIERAYARRRRTVPALSLIKHPRFRPRPRPHAPVLRVGSEEIKEGSPHFKPLAEIIRGVWQAAGWTCLECAVYQARGNKILRIQTGFAEGRAGPAAAGGSKRFFSKKELGCISKGRGKNRVS